MSREAMKLALEALETVAADVKTTPTAYEAQRQAITALREALAEQPAQQNSVTWAHKHINATLAAFGSDEAISMTQDTWAKLREAMSVLIEQTPQQEPAGSVYRYGKDSSGKQWHGIRWTASGLDLPEGTLIYTSPPPQQEPVFAIRALTDQCFALVQERDELQKQVWRYEKNGVTCQTYRHKVDASCSECNVHEVYTSPPAQRTWVGLTDEEVSKIIDDEIGFNSCWGPEEQFARAIEAKLKEKNI